MEHAACFSSDKLLKIEIPYLLDMIWETFINK